MCERPIFQGVSGPLLSLRALEAVERTQAVCSSHGRWFAWDFCFSLAAQPAPVMDAQPGETTLVTEALSCGSVILGVLGGGGD